jgi:hypothetical protein
MQTICHPIGCNLSAAFLVSFLFIRASLIPTFRWCSYQIQIFTGWIWETFRRILIYHRMEGLGACSIGIDDSEQWFLANTFRPCLRQSKLNGLEFKEFFCYRFCWLPSGSNYLSLLMYFHRFVTREYISTSESKCFGRREGVPEGGILSKRSLPSHINNSWVSFRPRLRRLFLKRRKKKKECRIACPGFDPGTLVIVSDWSVNIYWEVDRTSGLWARRSSSWANMLELVVIFSILPT